MEMLISSYILWIAPAMLCWLVLPSAWLNGRARLVGRIAEGIAWSGVVSALIGTVLWLLWGDGPLVFTVTDAKLFGIRLDALSVTVFLLVCFLGAIILRYSKNYLAGDVKQGYFF
jgi:NAD(P)H-quinone oxidoreductase subunit 5